MTPRLGPEGFAELVPVSRETLSRLEAYAALLTQWSARINLVGRDTLADLWRRHILDSAQLHPLIPSSTQNVIDLGSGTGFDCFLASRQVGDGGHVIGVEHDP